MISLSVVLSYRLMLNLMAADLIELMLSASHHSLVHFLKKVSCFLEISYLLMTNFEVGVDICETFKGGGGGGSAVTVEGASLKSNTVLYKNKMTELPFKFIRECIKRGIDR